MNDNSLQAPALICVDWGSSNFRAFLLDGEGNLLDSIRAQQGMLTLRQEQFETTLLGLIAPWLEGQSLPVLMAGMVGSAQGWRDAGYVDCPVTLDRLAAQLCWVSNGAGLKIGIVPGIRARSQFEQADVMRGEEVQVFGALRLLQKVASERELLSRGEALFCLPGTHCKWASIAGPAEQAQILTFTTQMTGELYSLLRQHSILGRLISADAAEQDDNFSAFDRGVARSRAGGGLLHHLFSARTEVLSGTLSGAEIGSYMSGMLLGHEIKEMLATLTQTATVYLVGSDSLNTRYRRVLEHAGVNVCPVNGDQAAWQGMLSIARQAGLINEEENRND
ncbi:MAG: 2-dehydro-3-deoxygalactonokinase [Gammaproteobacteria bacterium]|nr:2-dehydro-3-deoxygalactonokinase [Gammaproteobacteria bacterium]